METQTLTEITDLPQSNVGAPLPIVLATEYQLILLYMVQEYDPDWDGTYTTSVGRDTKTSIVVVRFEHAGPHLFGPPNDEALHGHPLHSLGLEAHACFEVRPSAWIAELCRRNSVHPNHTDASYDDDRHFIFTFHDSTFEVVAHGFSWEVVSETSIGEEAARIVAGWSG